VEKQSEAQFLASFTDAQVHLFSYILTLLPNVADARDVLQETSLALWEHREEYQQERPFWPWARRFAELRVLAFVQRRKREQQHLGRIYDERMVQVLAAEAGDGDDAALLLRQEALEHCRQKLSAASIDMLDLHYAQSLSCRQIGSRCGQSAGAVKTALFRIRQKLSECIRRRLAVQEGP
jgi:RNA polymerase sigma-70 factor (ECF subfamily)